MRLKFKARSEGWEAVHAARFLVGLLCVCFPWGGAGAGEAGAAGTGALSVSSPEGVALSGRWASKRWLGVSSSDGWLASWSPRVEAETILLCTNQLENAGSLVEQGPPPSGDSAGQSWRFWLRR